MKITTFLLTAVLLLSSCHMPRVFKPTKLQHDWPDRQYYPEDIPGEANYNNAQVAAGIIYLKSHDTISGLIKLLPYQNSRITLPNRLPILRWQDIKDYNITWFRWPKVDSLHIFRDTVNDYPAISFIKVYQHELWQPIAISKNAGIYTPRLFAPKTGKYFSHIILYSNGKKHRIINRYFYGDIYAKHLYRPLRRFIHRRYAINKHLNNFKNEREMFDFILQQEAKKAAKH